jgi:hypothetical protein
LYRLKESEPLRDSLKLTGDYIACTGNATPAVCKIATDAGHNSPVTDKKFSLNDLIEITKYACVTKDARNDKQFVESAVGLKVQIDEWHKLDKAVGYLADQKSMCLRLNFTVVLFRDIFHWGGAGDAQKERFHFAFVYKGQEMSWTTGAFIYNMATLGEGAWAES